LIRPCAAACPPAASASVVISLDDSLGRYSQRTFCQEAVAGTEVIQDMAGAVGQVRLAGSGMPARMQRLPLPHPA
jgi:hypothetical protein